MYAGQKAQFNNPSLKPQRVNEYMVQNTRNSFIACGIGASLVLTTAYFLIVSLVDSFDHAVTTFFQHAYLFIPLIVTVGIETALFSYAKQPSKLALQKSANIAFPGGISTASMILCGAHKISDITAVGLTAVREVTTVNGGKHT